MLRKTVADPHDSDWKSSVAVGLRVEYGEQTARETKQNADAFETPTLLDDEVHRRDMTVPGREDIYNRPGSHSNLFFSLAWQKISLALARFLAR